jgi:outer membrane lipoprotein-sorting protein
LLPLLRSADAAELNIPWLTAQTNIQTWSADFRQTRTFKALTQPLLAQGHVWFSAPKQFRWELGDPPQTIAVRQTDQMLVIYPQLKRVERYPIGAEQRGPWQDTLALLEAGFPRSIAEIESRFRLLSFTNVNGGARLTLQPKSAAARRWVGQMQIEFATNTSALLATELTFSDGSTLRNDFTNAAVNLPLSEGLFNPKLEADYKIVEPLSHKP